MKTKFMLKSDLNKEEKVVLVNEKNEILGEMLKSKIHTRDTPLHRGFSCFWFNQKGELLLQQRSKFKKTWPLTWSNSCCGHPFIDENSISASKRRLKFELDLVPEKILEIFPNYRYCFVKNGIMENEICPILVAFGKQYPKINSKEVESIKWLKWLDFLDEINQNPQKYSPWCVEETQLLGQNKDFLSFLEQIKLY
jgi:isopentenyl-diphosphate Delta-isomerase